MRCSALFVVCVSFAQIVLGMDDLSKDSSDSNFLLQSKVESTQGIQAKKTCLDAASFYAELSQQAPWKKYSQGHQDFILASLFNMTQLGTTNKYYVEFGYNALPERSMENTRLLKENGWHGVRMSSGDSAGSAPAYMNLYQEWITPENVVSIFNKHDVPLEPDYVGIDIDSCDLWVFLGLTQTYRPRALSVEYNAKYGLEESKANACKDSEGHTYSWNIDDMYGASLGALDKAAQKMGYTMVAVEKQLDVFLVRKDLVCPGSEVPLEEFRQFTSLTFPRYAKGNASEVQRWIVDYNP